MGKILRKRMKKLETRRNFYDRFPPCKGEPHTNSSNRQDHGMNRNGNIAKRPGSMTK